jgi:hypothetical protein
MEFFHGVLIMQFTVADDDTSLLLTFEKGNMEE